MVTKSVTEFKNYGKCVKLSNGIIEAIATVDLGPRIVFFGFVGGENVMCTKKDEFEPIQNTQMDAHFYPGATWNNYGGHRLWASPEVMPNTYYPDCEPVTYEFTENGVRLTQNPQTQNGLAMGFELNMDPEKPEIKVLHQMKNIGAKPQDLSLWALSVCNQNGTLIIPTNQNNTGLLHNRVISIWSYDDISDERIYFGKNFVTVKQNPERPDPFKLGFDLNRGTVYYALQNSVFKKQYAQNHPTGRYPDGGVSMETYCCGLFIEIETLSEQRVMQPGDTATHPETWTMLQKPFDFDRKNGDAIAAFVDALQ